MLLRKYSDPAFWDDWYGRQDKPVEWSTPASPALLARIREVLDSLPRPDASKPLRICEVGCGTSSLAVALAGEGIEVCGVDFSKEVIAQMAQRHPNLEWRQCDVLEMSQAFPPGSFDCVIAKTMLDCLLTRRDSESAVRQFLEETRTVLSDHGRLVLIDRGEASSFFRKGQVESCMVEPGARPMHFRVLGSLTLETSDAEKGDFGTTTPFERKNLMLRWVKKGAGLSTRRVAGGGALLVLEAEGCASAAGIRKGDRIVSVNNGHFSLGWLQRRVLTNSRSEVKLVVEHPTSTSHANDRARVSSQDDHLLRMRRAAILRSQSVRASYRRKKTVLPQLPNPISVSRDVTQGLFRTIG
eukprot:gnl/MRDRNA2_/MRDRNA2_110615_c0_seq1.p1 gnl/MRDRNA2_/MRDRNA2_110615_c0~~gnl/MRDRNA2_/MRDRNA2_110615_c0_seq1.p1  ORF type:complete len:355 (-),score=61.66 gnl/MRDRNA2_/MRDRNA2_110615_c0_seq1:164-1228(-)